MHNLTEVQSIDQNQTGHFAIQVDAIVRMAFLSFSNFVFHSFESFRQEIEQMMHNKVEVPRSARVPVLDNTNDYCCDVTEKGYLQAYKWDIFCHLDYLDLSSTVRQLNEYILKNLVWL